LRLVTSLEVDEIKEIIGEIREKWGTFRSEEFPGIYGV